MAVVTILLWLYLTQGQPGNLPSRPTQESAFNNIGVVYITITPSIAAYYGLGVDSGALVTEVVSGSPADRAHIRAGYVILSFNGAKLAPDVPLLGMIQACDAGHGVALEIWDGKATRLVEVVHPRS